MKDTNNNYINAFNKLSLDDKRNYILENIDEIIVSFCKISVDYNKECDLLNVGEYETEDEYLNELFKKIISLKGVSANVINVIIENLYEGEDYE